MSIQINLTKHEIESDIEGFEEHIAGIRDRLSKLPARGKTAAETRKLNKTRMRLLQEIEQVQRLIAYAQDALNEKEKFNG